MSQKCAGQSARRSFARRTVPSHENDWSGGSRRSDRCRRRRRWRMSRNCRRTQRCETGGLRRRRLPLWTGQRRQPHQRRQLDGPSLRRRSRRWRAREQECVTTGELWDDRAPPREKATPTPALVAVAAAARAEKQRPRDGWATPCGRAPHSCRRPPRRLHCRMHRQSRPAHRRTHQRWYRLRRQL